MVAESFEQARDAAFLVKTQYDVQEPVASWEEGQAKVFAPKEVGGEGAKVEILADGVSSIEDAINSSPAVLLWVVFHVKGDDS
ncbi:MAG: hypothetical protein JO232_22530 [Verrucomicrobia bacterium]|nr:hypothetical protein [Verrucomicrobiota bacterium]